MFQLINFLTDKNEGPNRFNLYLSYKTVGKISLFFFFSLSTWWVLTWSKGILIENFAYYPKEFKKKILLENENWDKKLDKYFS